MAITGVMKLLTDNDANVIFPVTLMEGIKKDGTDQTLTQFLQIMEGGINTRIDAINTKIPPERVRKISFGIANPNAASMEDGEVYFQYE